MNNKAEYRLLSHLDHPKRIFGITLDELMIAGLGAVFVILSTNKVIVIVFSALVLLGFRKLKQNRGPRFLWVLIYWFLPASVTRFLLPKMPDSAKRFWIS